MAQYGIGLSALNAFSEAIDVTSNNIANGQTVGYKQAEYVFADQFFKAQNPQARDRAGMGTSRMIIRRANTYGTISGTQNPLDLAIAGPGMFMLAKQVDGTVPTENPQKFQYTRNGQFAVDSSNRIVNENGLFLVGYAADSDGTVLTDTKSVLKLDTEPLAQVLTQESTIEINIDNRADSLAGRAFDLSDPASYSQSTTQTIYDDIGETHTLALYYKKVNSADLVLTDTAKTGTTFTFAVTQSLGTTLNSEQTNQIATTAVASTVTGATQTLSSANLTYLSGGVEQVNGIGSVTITNGGSGLTDGIYKNIAFSGGYGSGAVGTFTVLDGAVTSIQITSTGTTYGSSDTLSAEVDGDTISFSVASRTTAVTGEDSKGAVYSLTLDDGTILTLKQTSLSTAANATYNVQVDRYAIFATLDSIPVGTNSDDEAETTIYLSGEENTEQTSIGTMAFIGGKNLDSLSRDAYNKPQFISKLSIYASGTIDGDDADWSETDNGGNVYFDITSTETTGYSSSAQTYSNTQDGSATSQLTAYSFDAYGKLVAQYDNGKSVTKGQLILATFNNFEGLIPVGGNGFQASATSGDPLIDTPNGSQMGAIRAQAVEESNVDLTQQLVRLMVLQRAYSAASQATKVQVATLVDDTLRIGQ